MARGFCWSRCFHTKPGNLNLIPRIHMVEGENLLLSIVLWHPHMCEHTNKIDKCQKLGFPAGERKYLLFKAEGQKMKAKFRLAFLFSVLVNTCSWRRIFFLMLRWLILIAYWKQVNSKQLLESFEVGVIVI